MGVCGPAFFAPTTLDPTTPTLVGIYALLDHWWTFDDVLTDSISSSAEGALAWSGPGSYVASGTGKKIDNTSTLTTPATANACKTSNWSLGGRFTFNNAAQQATFLCARSSAGASYERVYLQIQSTGAISCGFHTGTAFVAANSAAGLITSSSSPRSVVGTYDGATLRVYLDGAEVASLATTAAPATDQARLEIGYDFAANFSVDNDEVFIARQALTLGQVKGLHNGGSGRTFAEVAYGDTNLTITGTLAAPRESTAQSSAFATVVSVAPLTWSISAGSLPAGLSLNPSTGVISGTVTATAGTAYSFTLRVVDANGKDGVRAFSGTVAVADAWEAAVAALPLELWLRANETSGTTLADASGNGRTATLTGSPPLNQAALFTNTGPCAQFGAGRYARVASVAGLQFATADFIVGLAFKRTAAGDGSFGKLVWKTANYVSGHANYLLQYGRDTNKVTARVSHSGNVYFDVTSPGTFALNTSYLVFLRRLGAEISLWVNGSKVASANLPSSSTALLTTTDPVDFMGGPTNSTDQVNAYGDELIIARGSISDTTMAALWAARQP